MNLEIQLNSEIVGKLEFLPRLGNARKTALGFSLDLPVELLLWPTGTLKARPVVTDLCAELNLVDARNTELELGTISSEGIYEARDGRYPALLNFRWSAPLSVLVELERARNGAVPRFRIRVRGYVGIKIDGPRPGVELASIPKRFWGQGDIEYPAEQWRDALKALQLTDLVLLEIPLQAAPPQGFDEVWQNLAHARNVFMGGGPFAWESCAVAVRRALEAWEKVEPLQTSTPAGGQHRTKRERLDQVRKELKYYLGYSAHPQGAAAAAAVTEWTREDALLGLTTMCGLLSTRRP